MVIDYCSLNKQTIKNNYPLPLITDLINNIGSKRVFTKMDLQWGFNNIRIKEGDEQKGTFTIYVGLFEPTVMFFGITNSLATFQVIINEILRDLVNEGKITVFVDNMLVETKTEEGHNEIMEEVLRRLEENDLYMKPEKCMWKVNITNFIWTITPGILDRFQRSKWPPKALKKTFLTVPKMSQSDQYSPSYQQISL